jgi:acyl-CoA synthetase (AMP-forming)/AMP-acid ligase II
MSPPAKTRAEDYGPSVEEYSGSLWSTLQKPVQQHPDNIALICCQQANDHLSWLSPPGTGNQKAHFEWTYAQLLRAAEALGRSLQHAGLDRASRLVALCPNNAEWTVLLWACAAIGVTFVPLNPGLIGREKEMRHVLGTIRPSGIAVFNEKDVLQLDAKYSDVLDIRLKLHLGPKSESTPINWVNLIDLVENSPVEREGVADTAMHNAYIQSPNDDVAAIILFTSGTTSLPKAVPHTGKSLEAQSRLYWSVRRMQSGSKVVTIGPGVRIETSLLGTRNQLTKVVPHPHRIYGTPDLASRRQSRLCLPAV